MKNLFIILLLSHSLLNAQDYSDSLKTVEDSFKSFKYAEVVKKTPDLLKNGNFSPDTLINIYMMKGISHYALQEDTLAKKSFQEIIKLDSSFTPDSVIISPKIVAFFSAVKQQSQNITVEETVVAKDTVIQIVPDTSSYLLYSEKVRSTVLRSILFPGLGHIYAGDSKGWYLTTVAGISLVSAIYFSIETENKKTDYLNEQDLATISNRYDEYNSAYRARNISLLTFGAVWLFAQIDLLTSSILDFDPGTFLIAPSAEGAFISFQIKL